MAVVVVIGVIIIGCGVCVGVGGGAVVRVVRTEHLLPIVGHVHAHLSCRMLMYRGRWSWLLRGLALVLQIVMVVRRCRWTACSFVFIKR